MNHHRRPWCSDHRQLVTLLTTLLGKRTESCRQADHLVRLISKLMPALKCNRTLSKISSPSICLELTGLLQNCFSSTLRTARLSGPRVTGPHLASINTWLSVVLGVDLHTQEVVELVVCLLYWAFGCVFEYLTQSSQAVAVVILRACV